VVKKAEEVDSLIKSFAEELKKEIPVQKIYLFGSYAWGIPTKESDIDILILLSESIEPKARRAATAYKALRDFTDFPIDILVRTSEEFVPYSKVAATLHYKIANQGIVLYEE